MVGAEHCRHRPVGARPVASQREVGCRPRRGRRISNEVWYGDQPPDLGKGFTAAKTNERTSTVTEILLRAAKRAEKNGTADLAEVYYQLYDKIEGCRARRRCGSLGCPRCARAFQKAKVVAHQDIITSLKKGPNKHLVWVTVIPRKMMYQPGQFAEIDVKKANRWLKDALKAIGNRTILGSADLGWETRRGKGYIQIHWHLVIWTGNKKKLKKKLAYIFTRTKKHERPVEVRPAEDLGFLPYMNKIIKLVEWLRYNRKQLPELLLVFDRTDPVDFLVQTKLKLIAQAGRLAFKRIGQNER
jgi:hypothetical protein